MYFNKGGITFRSLFSVRKFPAEVLTDHNLNVLLDLLTLSVFGLLELDESCVTPLKLASCSGPETLTIGVGVWGNSLETA